MGVSLDYQNHQTHLPSKSLESQVLVPILICEFLLISKLRPGLVFSKLQVKQLGVPSTFILFTLLALFPP